jgi:Zn-dependent protease with chaperone function
MNDRTTMDFFAHQDAARHKTKWLVCYFVLAVVLIVVSVYLSFVGIFFMGSSRTASKRHRPQPAIVLWQPRMFLWVGLGTLGVIGCGSAYRMLMLRKGGSAVAEMLGGRRVISNTTCADERKLLNVVEEMSIASGVPMPDVYVLEDEEGINAFAAGHSTNEAVIGVTKGCLRTLNRDELQGVIAHEFSHVLNGDMALNVRLIGIIFGILCIATFGRILLRTRGRKNPLPAFGLALLVVGWVGVFFGRLIQAAVSRQREFLADASAVQFTRNPEGLAGALKKIGGSTHGAQLESSHAADASHLFFGNALGASFLGMLATHPPLEDRIRAIEPAWDGRFPGIAPSTQMVEAIVRESKIDLPRRVRMQPAQAAGGLAGISSKALLASVGNPTPLHLRYAEEIRDSFPKSISMAARQAHSAAALLYAMLLSRDERERASQLRGLANFVSPVIHQQVESLSSDVAEVAERARLPLMNLALPALREMSPDEYEQFKRVLQWLIESDRQIDLFEYMLQKVVRRHLDPHFVKTKHPTIQYYAMRPLERDCVALLSLLARVGHSNPAEMEKAFHDGLPHLRIPSDNALTILPDSESGLKQADAALDRISQAVPQIKKNVLIACVYTVGADGVMQEREAELLRAIADALDCPVSPLLHME